MGSDPQQMVSVCIKQVGRPLLLASTAAQKGPTWAAAALRVSSQCGLTSVGSPVQLQALLTCLLPCPPLCPAPLSAGILGSHKAEETGPLKGGCTPLI